MRAAALDILSDPERSTRPLTSATLVGRQVDGQSFGIRKDAPVRFEVNNFGPMLDEFHSRLTGVVIERLPYADLIRRYDAPGTLFFLDPPYWGCEGDYGPGVFERADFELLAEQLAGIAGRFILTINATDGARDVFNRFQVKEVDTTYSIGASASGSSRAATELIVRG